MNHHDHVSLIEGGIPTPGGIWADLGSGGGAFTLALADILGRGAEIYSVDKDRGALREQERAMRLSFPEVMLHYMAADFTRPLELPPLDGIVMANSLHYVRDKERLLPQIRGYLKPGGRLILIEYNVDKGNMWVPHPLSYGTWEKLATRCGFAETRLLATVPSRFLGEIYSAVSLAPQVTGGIMERALCRIRRHSAL
jgi:SAM-dependent methyltransferase